MNTATTKPKPKSFLTKLWEAPLTTTRLINILFSLFVVTLIITIWMIIFAYPIGDSAEKINIEIIKSLVQILVVTIIGGIVGALFKAHERNQEQDKIRLQLKLDFIKRIGELYRSVKKSRRLLRSRGIKMEMNDVAKAFNEEQIKFYSNELLKLNDVQLELEGYKIASDKSLFFEKSDQIIKYLERMESYLNKIINQYEKGGQSLEKYEKDQFNDFIYLWEFTAESRNTYLIDKEVTGHSETEIKPDFHYNFKNSFSLSYANILSELITIYDIESKSKTSTTIPQEPRTNH